MYTSQKKKKRICYLIHVVEYLNTWIQSYPTLSWPELNSEKKAEMMTKTGLNRSQLNNWMQKHCSRCREKCPLSPSFIVDQEQPISDKNTITSKNEEINGNVVLKSKQKKRKYKTKETTTRS